MLFQSVISRSRILFLALCACSVVVTPAHSTDEECIQFTAPLTITNKLNTPIISLGFVHRYGRRSAGINSHYWPEVPPNGEYKYTIHSASRDLWFIRGGRSLGDHWMVLFAYKEDGIDKIFMTIPPTGAFEIESATKAISEIITKLAAAAVTKDNPAQPYVDPAVKVLTTVMGSGGSQSLVGYQRMDIHCRDQNKPIVFTIETRGVRMKIGRESKLVRYLPQAAAQAIKEQYDAALKKLKEQQQKDPNPGQPGGRGGGGGPKE